MKKRTNAKRILSCMMAGLTLISTAASPISAYAGDSGGTVPLLADVIDQLDADEIVEAADYEVEVGSAFDISSDFTNITIPDLEKVAVTFKEAVNDDGEDFSTDYADTYEAVYYVEPLTTDHPTYQVSRNITVKETESSAADSSAESGSGSDENGSDEDDTGGDDDEDDSLSLLEKVTAALYAGVSEDEDSDTTEALTTEGAEELTTEEFEEEIESTEEQETVDEETGLTLAEALEAGEEEGISLASLDAGETVSYSVSVSAAAATVSASSTTTETVTITRGSWYYYADYGLGSYMTAPYYVSYGSITATAYCVQPSKSGPDDGTYTITKLSDGKTLAKVCYYGTKAAGDEGFFEEYYPDFSTGKRFIITHLAAAYANGSDDAFSGTNSTGQALAMELYNYCLSQPDIPDVDMSFSDDSVTAYVDGTTQRTKEVTFSADELQTITFDLPDGVKLHNVTTGETSSAGASVTISGGTVFYLSAPLTQASDVSASWSSTMTGSITKEYSAYKITTGSSTQNLAFVFGEGVDNEKEVTFSVTWADLVQLSIVKKDADTSNVLAGAVYGVYSDSDCSTLITELPETDSKGTASITFAKTQDTIYLKEISAPDGYYRDTTVYTVSVSGSGVVKVAKTFTDERVTAKISISKEDSETGKTAQGDATLEGAVYGLYAKSAITHPDGTTGTIYKAGELVTTMTTDADGNAEVSGLYLGEYYVKEITAPVGYNLDETEYDLTCDYEGDLVAVVEKTTTVEEDVIKQPFQVIKAANNGKTDADLLSGVGFTVYLVSSLTTNADGSYDFDSAEPVVVTEDSGTEMFTDEKGYACSIPLPYGTYIVRETTTPHNYSPVDDFIVTITENSTEPQTWRVLLDEEFEAKLKITKKDDETKQSVLLANTEFKVYDLDNEEYVEQVTTYPTTTVHTSYFTDEEGYLILPEYLSPGNYRIEEVIAPDGYTLNTEYVEISVDSNTAYLVDSVSGDTIIEVDYENHAVKGELTIEKSGETLVGFKGDFVYEETSLEGAVFEVYAAEDIYTADHQTDENGNRNLMYAKGALVATVTTDENGKAVVEDLPLGTYTVKEVTAPEGFVLNTVSQDVEFSYEDQDTAVVKETVSFTDERQKVSISVKKTDAETSKVLSGAVFGLYNAEDIYVDGRVIMEAGTLIETVESDESGKAVFTKDLPLGQYYVKEITAPDGYLLSDEVVEFDASYQGQDVETITLTSTVTDIPTTIELTKTDLTTGEELPGAHLEVTDSKGNVVDEWVSTEEAHVIKALVIGETYTMTETIPAEGYVTAESITFTVEDTAEVQCHEMQDDVTKVEISKTDITGEEEIPGATLTILDEDGNVVETWVSGDEPHYIEKLPIGEYTLHEEQAPDGYVIASDVTFTVADTGEIQTVTMKDETAKGKVIINKTDADTGEALKGVRFELRDSDGNVLEVLKTDKNGYAESSLYEIADFTDGVMGESLHYVLVETKTVSGYVLDTTEYDVTFEYVDDETPVIEVTFDLTNEKTPETSHGPKTGDDSNVLPFILLLLAAGGGIGGAAVMRRRRRSC
ncbi:MAG: Cna protein B-type domain protein [Clostridiales bacterium]|nr:Cna protein B-type domain protein [Clostridiales bacterium]